MEEQVRDHESKILSIGHPFRQNGHPFVDRLLNAEQACTSVTA
jgi:hypothetical protein